MPLLCEQCFVAPGEEDRAETIGDCPPLCQVSDFERLEAGARIPYTGDCVREP